MGYQTGLENQIEKYNGS